MNQLQLDLGSVSLVVRIEWIDPDLQISVNLHDNESGEPFQTVAVFKGSVTQPDIVDCTLFVNSGGSIYPEFFMIQPCDSLESEG